MTLALALLAATAAVATGRIRSSLAALRQLQQDHRSKLLGSGHSPQDDSKTLGALLGILQELPLEEVESRMDRLEARLESVENRLSLEDMGGSDARTARMLQTTGFATQASLDDAVRTLNTKIINTQSMAKAWDGIILNFLRGNVTVLNNYIRSNETTITGKLGTVNASLSSNLTGINKALDVNVAQINADLSSRAADLLNEMDNRRAQLQSYLDSSLTKLHDTVAAAQEDGQILAADAAIATLDSGVDGGSCCDNLRDELMGYIQGNVTAILGSLEQTNTALAQSIEDSRQEVVAYVDGLRDDLVAYIQAHWDTIQDTTVELTNAIIELSDSVEALVSNVHAFETQTDEALAGVVGLVDDTKAATISEIQAWVNERLLKCCPVYYGTNEPAAPAQRRLGAVLEDAEGARIKLLKVLAARKEHSRALKGLFGLETESGATNLSRSATYAYLKRVRESARKTDAR